MPNLKSKVSLRERVEEVLLAIELDDDGACGDPECCGSPSYHISEKSVKEAIVKLHPILKESMPKQKINRVMSTDYGKAIRNEGYNLALSEVNEVLEGLLK